MKRPSLDPFCWRSPGSQSRRLFHLLAAPTMQSSTLKAVTHVDTGWKGLPGLATGHSNAQQTQF